MHFFRRWAHERLRRPAVAVCYWLAVQPWQNILLRPYIDLIPDADCAASVYARPQGLLVAGASLAVREGLSRPSAARCQRIRQRAARCNFVVPLMRSRAR